MIVGKYPNVRALLSLEKDEVETKNASAKMITRYVNKMLSSFRALHPKGIQMRGERRGACNLCEK